MKRIITILFVMGVVLMTFFTTTLYAKSSDLDNFNTKYGTSGTALNTCSLCHTSVPALNPYGTAFKSSGRNFTTIEPLDSDGDTFSNITEINARTFPGDPTSKPAGDTTPPTVTSFTIPATSSSLTVPVTALAATDNAGVTGFLLTESATKPAASATGWTATPPTNHTFASAGTKTLYAWAKDAAGNVSNSRSATTTVALTDNPPETPFDMSIWIGKWFKMNEKYIGYEMQDSIWARHQVTFPAYMKIYDWDPKKNILKADRYEYDAESGQWFTEPLTLNYLSGSVLDFLCSALTIDEQTNSTYGFTARISGSQRRGFLEARFKTLGGYYVSVKDGEPGNEYSAGNLIIQGNLISESDIPVPAGILLN